MMNYNSVVEHMKDIISYRSKKVGRTIELVKMWGAEDRHEGARPINMRNSECF